MRAQLGDDRNPDTLRHTHLSVKPHTRKSAMLWLGCHSAKLAKLDEAMRAQLAMIGTLTHSSPLSATLAGASAQPPPTQERSEP